MADKENKCDTQCYGLFLLEGNDFALYQGIVLPSPFANCAALAVC